MFLSQCNRPTWLNMLWSWVGCFTTEEEDAHAPITPKFPLGYSIEIVGEYVKK